MNKNVINILNILMSIFILLILIYICYNLILPIFYNKEFDIEKNKKGAVDEEEIKIVNVSLKKYIDACATSDQEKIKSMLPLAGRFKISNYNNVFDIYEENEITNSEQCIIYNVEKVGSNIYQVNYYLKSGNVVDGLVYNTVVIQIRHTSHSFRIFYDKACILKENENEEDS